MEMRRLSSFVRKSFGATKDEKTGAQIGYYSDDYSSDDSEEKRSLTDEAAAAEGMLGDALSIASARTGSLLSLQNVPKQQALELGRQASLLSKKEGEEFSDDRSYVSARSIRSIDPVFIKAPKGDPTILTQKSWDALVEMENKPDLGDAKLRSVMSDQQVASLKPRKWDKLRKDLKNQDKNRGNFLSRGLKKTFGAFKKKKSKLQIKEGSDVDPEGSLAATPRTLESSPSQDSDSNGSIHSSDSADSSQTEDSTDSSSAKDPPHTRVLKAPSNWRGKADAPERNGLEVPLTRGDPEVSSKGLSSAAATTEKKKSVDPPSKGFCATSSDEACDSHLICFDNHRIMVETRQGEENESPIDSREPTARIDEEPEVEDQTFEEQTIENESTEVVYSGCGDGCMTNPCIIFPSFGPKTS